MGSRSAVESNFNCHSLASDTLSARLAGTLELKATKENAHSDLIRSVAFSPDGKTIVSGSYDEMIKVWQLVFWSYSNHHLFDEERRGHVWSVFLIFWSLELPVDVIERIVSASM